MKERLSTKVTKLKTSVWGCRVLLDDKPLVEIRVTSRDHIGPAIKDMLRTLDKLSYCSDMAKSARHRLNSHTLGSMGVKFKYIWLQV